jgi:hypothetical protein
MPGVKNRTLWRLRARLRIVTSKMRLYRWRYFCVKYLRAFLKVLVSLLISILAELGIKFFNKD